MGYQEFSLIITSQGQACHHRNALGSIVGSIVGCNLGTYCQSYSDWSRIVRAKALPNVMQIELRIRIMPNQNWYLYRTTLNSCKNAQILSAFLHKVFILANFLLDMY